MKTWFNCKVRYHKQDDEGRVKRVLEQYLVDAESYTEAEARIYERMQKIVSGVFDITNISKTNVVEVVNYEDSEYWHKCKMTYVSVDEESEKAKKVTKHILVNANTVESAYDRMIDNLSTMLVPFEVPSVVLTKIIDVFPYHNLDDIEENNVD